ncbi:Severin, partial [Colletotrichum tanaceti]
MLNVRVPVTLKRSLSLSLFSPCPRSPSLPLPLAVFSKLSSLSQLTPLGTRRIPLLVCVFRLGRSIVVENTFPPHTDLFAIERKKTKTKRNNEKRKKKEEGKRTMAPTQGLVHLKEYDVKDSNVELIGTEIDHQVKYKSAAAEPAWNDGRVGREAGLRVWRVEDFEVKPWPPEKYGQFLDGDSYVVLHSYQVGKDKNKNKNKNDNGDGDEGTEETAPRLGHDVFFWLGAHTSQDEAGTAAYKTVELDEFLRGAAAQHRELQAAPSDAFLALFPRISIRSGGVGSGFRHVEAGSGGGEGDAKEPVLTLLRVFKNPSAGVGGVVVHEVEPRWQSLDEGDVFVLDAGDKIWQWQGRSCSPMEKAKAAQVVNDMTLAKHVDVEVLAQDESRSRVVVTLLGGGGNGNGNGNGNGGGRNGNGNGKGDSDGDDDNNEAPRSGFRCPRPVRSATKAQTGGDRPQKLFRLSDVSGELRFNLVKDGGPATRLSDFDGRDVFLLDDAGRAVWVWEGEGASRGERASWLRVAQAYIRQLQGAGGAGEAHLTPLAKVR